MKEPFGIVLDVIPLSNDNANTTAKSADAYIVVWALHSVRLKEVLRKGVEVRHPRRSQSVVMPVVDIGTSDLGVDLLVQRSQGWSSVSRGFVVGVVSEMPQEHGC